MLCFLLLLRFCIRFCSTWISIFWLGRIGLLLPFGFLPYLALLKEILMLLLGALFLLQLPPFLIPLDPLFWLQPNTYIPLMFFWVELLQRYSTRLAATLGRVDFTLEGDSLLVTLAINNPLTFSSWCFCDIVLDISVFLPSKAGRL